jgi:Lon protease-like protein
MNPTRIPLFPLEVVLLPGMALPLHIFEPRYKVMVARCLNEAIEFGVILAAQKGMAGAGCTAEIVQKLKDYPDGRMDIMTEGRHVFELLELIEEQEYYEAKVRYLVDETETVDPRQGSRLQHLFQQVHALLAGQEWDAAGSDEEIPLAYRMSGVLPMELAERQRLLEMRTENARREFLFQWMTDFLPRLVHRQRVRERARGNGHALN